MRRAAIEQVVELEPVSVMGVGGVKTLITEVRNELIQKIIRTLELQTHEIAEVVGLYYDCQDLRIAHGNKKRTEAPSELVTWLDFWLRAGETVIYQKLKQWVESDRSPGESKWAFSQVGIGPVLAAGLAAHIDVEKAKTISSLWKFAGQAPGFDKRVRGQTLPYNSRLKVICWKLGDSFVKVSGKEDAVYGHLYARFKADEIKRNVSGHYAQAAAKELTSKKFRSDTETRARLEKGLLSDGHLHARAKRRAVKIFLSHYWLEARRARKLPVTKPWIFDLGGHAPEHEI